ncbi:choline binding protein J [Streptococcus pneumoniae]|nr:choline binding protein J [Streptococcus pneumoniae]
MKLLKKTMQAGLTVIFFGLLATNTVFADNSEGWQFVQENGRTITKRGTSKKPTGE